MASVRTCSVEKGGDHYLVYWEGEGGVQVVSRVAVGNRCKNLGLEIKVKNCRGFFLTSNIKGEKIRGQNISPDGKPSLPEPIGALGLDDSHKQSKEQDRATSSSPETQQVYYIHRNEWANSSVGEHLRLQTWGAQAEVGIFCTY